MPEALPRRPDPDALLARIRDDEARAARGHLKIFFGACAGVGKTCAMLAAARQMQAQGLDVVVGVVETHGRKDTEAMLDGLERLAPRSVSYRDRSLEEFDLDAALTRAPGLILMDELAHTNLAGSRHPKRWQDVEELLDAGIDVFTTVNVQHLETLNDVVSGITGIRVWETVPDHVFDDADEVLLVDLPPDELLQRLEDGKVYMPAQAERAAQNFFRKGNLIALRELALRRMADRVDGQMMDYRRNRDVMPVWQTRDSLLVCLGPDEGNDRLVRSTARLATRLDVPWHAVYVETPRLQRLPGVARQRILRSLQLAQRMGAQTETLAGQDVADEVIAYARQHNLGKVVVGRPARGSAASWAAWSRRARMFVRPWGHSLGEAIGMRAPDLEVMLLGRTGRTGRAERDAGTSGEADADGVSPTGGVWWSGLRAPWTAFAMSALLCALVTLLATPLHGLFDLTNIAMLFLLAVVLVSVRYGTGPSVLASFLNVAAFDFFFVPPRLSFAVSDVQYLLTFAVMLAVGLVTTRLTASLKYQARVAGRREQRVRALYEMARDLSGALMNGQIAEIGQRFAEAEFSARCVMLLANEHDQLGESVPAAWGEPLVDRGIAQWAYEHEQPAGSGTDTLPGSPLLYLPLRAPMRVRGVLVLAARDPRRLFSPEQRRLLDTFARLIAIALERVHYVDVAGSTTLEMESERLRNSLLSAISHDLRTPLAAMRGLAESVALTQPPPSAEQLALAGAMREEARRMSALVDNLLDMARLQSGTVRLNRQWLPLEELVGSALRAARPALGERSVQVSLPPDLPLIEMDAVLMERVLFNLLENAGKYTPEGSPLRIGAAVRDRLVDVWLDDEGPGLPPGREESVFGKFERGHSESSTPGVGLGLAICRAIVEAHGGRIWAANRITEGTVCGARFVFQLPLGQAPLPPRAEDLEAADHHD